jgi:hypothetical protein
MQTRKYFSTEIKSWVAKQQQQHPLTFSSEKKTTLET